MAVKQDATIDENPQGGMLTGNNQAVSESTPAEETDTPEQQTFTFVEGIETGKGSQNYLYGQEGEVQQLTVDQLRDYFEGDNVNRLQEQFGSFDNYLAYMTEREQLIQSGDYSVGNWAEADAGFTEDQEMILEGDADLTIDASDPTQNLENIRRQQTSSQSGAYQNWLNSDTNQALLKKYGVNPDVYSDSGDRFKWNGSAYVKVEDTGVGVSDYALAGMMAGAGAFLGPALSGAMGAGAGAAGAGGITVGGVAGSAAGNALATAIVQGVVNGEVDTSSLASAALQGGLQYIGDAIKASGLAEVGGDLGAAADNAIWDMADRLGTDYDTVFNIGSDIASGAISGQDVEEIALNALQTYSTSEIQNLVRETYANSMGNIDVDNVFREGETTIPVAALNPLIETAVGGFFGEDVDAEDIARALYDSATYSDPDSVDADMTLRFLDPGIDLPDVDLFEGTLPNFETPEEIKQIEDVARAVGSEAEDITRDVVRPIGEAAEEIKEALPHGTTPDLGDGLNIEGPDIALPEGPDIDLPDGPDIDLPSIKLTGGGGGSMLGGSPYMAGINYQLPQSQMILYKPPTANEILTDFTNGLVGQRGMLV